MGIGAIEYKVSGRSEEGQWKVVKMQIACFCPWFQLLLVKHAKFIKLENGPIILRLGLL